VVKSERDIIMGRIVGMENIVKYLGLSESTVMENIHHKGLPAEKKSGIWEVDQAALDRWNAPDPGEARGVKPKKKEPAAPAPAPPKKRSRRRRKSGRKK